MYENLEDLADLSAARWKKLMRGMCKDFRKTLSTLEKNRAIKEAFFASPFAEAERFFVYLSFGSEVSTQDIINELLQRGKKVLLPRIVQRDMLAVPYTDRRAVSLLGIPAPTEGEDSPCDVALTPLLAYDKEGYRLGYGGGYYDRYFASHQGVLRVGLAFAGQAVHSVPHEAWDVPLSAVVTEEGTTFFPKPSE